MATATTIAAKPSKWFANKTLKLSLPRFRSKSRSSTTSSSSANSSPKTSTSTKENELRQVFSYFDDNKDGKISVEELRAYFSSVGDSMSRDEAQRVILEFDKDGDNLLEFGDFVQLIETDNKGDEANDYVKKAFEMFEDDKGSGCITPKGLQLVLNRLGDPKSLEECEAMIRAYDLDGNGVLDFNEFHTMMS
ncbi:probable calcium-binding protein CML41 [Coffea eugenioides]|uniref:probable calcium-binding protein CML41 n=1 Tax=Coffea eugenioides TaxID=49369 RepID=UPI000F613CEA|nr:probable calcium-binding protein CML41 [Coffea eugenioides]